MPVHPIATFRALPRAGRIAAVIGLCVAVLLLLLAAFPWGLLRPILESRLSASLKRPVTIAAMRRTDLLSFMPVVELEGVRIAQPDWAGNAAMVQVARVRLRFPVLPLLTGRFRPRDIDLAGARFALVRTADGRSNWQGSDRDNDDEREVPATARLIVRDAVVTLDDARRRVRLTASLTSDARGFMVAGRGTHRGEPLQVAVRGASLIAADPDKAWPVTLAVASPLASLRTAARLDHPLDLRHLAARVEASGQDVTYLDDFVEAGLFHTQPFRLAGALRRDGATWRITDLAGRIGRSRLTTNLTVQRRNGRTNIDGAVKATALDFDDFASDAQRARGAAQARAAGPRIVPATRIRFDKLGKLDGTLRLDATRLLSRGGSPFLSLRTIAVMDHRRLVLSPLSVALRTGRLTGRIVVDHRKQAPRLTLDLAVNGARIETLIFEKGEIAGPLRARIRLAGSGDTVREAVGRSSGKVGIVVTDGSMRRDYVTFLGGDVFKSIGVAIGDEGKQRVAVRCLIADLPAHNGVLTPAPLALDSVIAGGRGEGRITLADERIDLRISGRAAKPGLLQSTTPVLVFGNLSQPKLDIRPPRAEESEKRGILSRIGDFIGGLKTRGDKGRARPAAPLDCGRLVARTLGS